MATPIQDTEITLGTGKLLGVFFGLVILCAVFFTLGYMLGHGGSSTGTTTFAGPVPSGGNPANKPSAGNKNAEAAPATQTTPDTTAGNPSDTPAVTTTPAADTPRPQDQADSARNAPPELKGAGAGTYMVQVAAVSRQEDAEILVAALRKKQYPVLMVSNVPGDSLFHVQVGPFTDPKEAESMRTRLANDGYNAILKK